MNNRIIDIGGLVKVNLKTKEIITRRQELEATKKMLVNIKLKSDNYNIDNRIKYLQDNNINVKYLIKK